MEFHVPPERGADFWLAGQAWLQIGALGLILIFLSWQGLRLLRQRAATRSPCRWRRENRQRSSGLSRWQCAACGVDAFTSDGRAPKECKRMLREASL